MASQDQRTADKVDLIADDLSSLVIHPDEELATTLAKVSRTPSSGFGVFATQDIPKGALIAVESAVISIPAVPDEQAAIEFCKALHQISKANLARLQSLSLDPLAWNSVSGDSVRSRIWQWCEDNLASNQGGQRKSHHELSILVDHTCRCYGIFLTNNLETGSNSGRGVYPFFSRMNHSCRPDIYEFFDTKTKELSLRAIHDIKAGDQIHSTYVDLLQPRKKRQKTLEAWGFTCQCPACTNQTFDALGERAVELDDMLEEYLFYHDDFSSDTDDDHEPFLKGPDEALGVAQELIQLLKDQGIYGESLYHTYWSASKLGVEVDDLQLALGYAREAREIEVCCVGPDRKLSDDDTVEWISYLESQIEHANENGSLSARLAHQEYEEYDPSSP
ncbi:SET domain-containing protein [Apiospora phragmitis]|uniref:SET domain-containing protein n=1 Tax=Apiospora phragmitis TaxID=2905665 RepID=A0ABR1T372_9PEZI